MAKGNSGPLSGTVKRIVRDRGFGFIMDTGGREYFFHRSACSMNGEGFDTLQETDAVSFTVGESPKGPRAENVQRAL